jgi:hypothetical protein
MTSVIAAYYRNGFIATRAILDDCGTGKTSDEETMI